MIRKIFLLLLITISLQPVFAQLKSPEMFLGYPIGTHFTPHWQIVNYFRDVAEKSGNMIRLEEYGKTNEGRPLLLAFISSPENIGQLEKIRQNNLRLAGMARDKMAADDINAPAIVWLSYNVHGNEASSSEAAMQTLYALADPANQQTKEWLKNTVVIIDPCINPDGRDRYVNWYNAMAGGVYNPDPQAREHDEPWPGGRTNHYYFDLNRDWAWQSQVESQQRLKKYNEWMPQIHVDYHEQGINAPYYFAPAAEPFHTVITPWQRSFQETIGRNHAKYFDKNGWLYFTKEIFDLYYPSYGDTWPTYNGAIGMTYEQGGGPRGGLGILNNINDTLRLIDRVMHHFTTSISTIETAALHRQELLKEFRKFFADAVQAGVGEYKTFIVKSNAGDAQRLLALQDLLDKNDITYGTAQANIKGYNFISGKDEMLAVNKNDIVISSLQPKSALIKVLFEPNPQLVDSNTYDITAWALPYVYGLQVYASRDKLVPGPSAAKAVFANPLSGNAYAYVFKWEGMQSARLVAQLLKANVKLRFAESPFEINGQQYGRGSVIVLQAGNENLQQNLSALLSEAANNTRVSVTPVTTGFVDKGYDFGSSRVHPLKAPKVAVLSGEGTDDNAVGEVWFYFDKELQYPVSLINAADFSVIDLHAYDVLVMPAGRYKFLNDKQEVEKLHDWVKQGGNLIAMENAVSQLARQEWSIRERKSGDTTTEKSPYEVLKKYANRDRDYIPDITPGAILKVDLDNTHPLAFGYPPVYYTLKKNDVIYDFIEDGGWNVGVIKKEKPVMGFVGYKLKQKLKDGLVFGVQEMGRGNITYLADDILFRDFWENGKLMFSNAVFMVGQ